MPFFIPALIAAGVSLVVGVGTTLVANALAPTQKINTGSLDDLSVPKSNYGAVVPQCWGTLKVAGNLLWSAPKREVTRTKRTGGKGGPKVETRKTTYYGSFAVMFAYCRVRPAERLKRLWLNGKLVYDSTETDPEIASASNDFFNNHIRFYNGAVDQPVDPLLQNAPPIQSYDYGLPHDPEQRAIALTDLGLDPNLNHIPAYRLKCYIVLENLPLTDYNSQIPVVKAEIVFNEDNTLETIVTDICNSSKITNFDTTGINDVAVPGFYLDKIITAKDALLILQQAFFFDIILSGETLKFVLETVPRIPIVIPNTDLAAFSGDKRPAPFTLPKPDPEDLPESVEISFIDRDGAYETSTVLSRSQVATSKKKEIFDFPIVMSSDRAQAIADSILHKFYLKAIKPKELSLPPKYCYLEPGDWLLTELNGRAYNLQIASIQLGANRMLKLDTVVVEAADLDAMASPPTSISTGGYNPPIIGSPPVSVPGITNLQVMDINLISDRDEDYGVYVSANGSWDWREASVYVSNDDSSYFFTGVTLSEGTIGTLVSPLSSNSTTIEVNLRSGEFESISDVDFDNGVNKLLIGNEIIQFQNATFDGTNYQLSELRRGLRGTETYMDTHSIGSRVVLLSGDGVDVVRIPGNNSDLGQIRYFKAPSAGQSLDAVTAVPVEIEGNALKPYAPVNLGSTVDNVGNITLTWDRRDRHAGNYTAQELADGVSNLPLSELEEKWEIEVLDLNGAVIRTETTSANFFNYRETQQNQDWGSTQNSISVNIYQISAIVGRGYRANATLTPTFFQPSPVITNIYPNPAPLGSLITIEGTGLNEVAAVYFGESFPEAENLNVLSDEKITFKFTNESFADRTENINFITGNTTFFDVSLINEFTETKLSIVNNGGGGDEFGISDFTEVFFITNDLVIEDSHFGALLIFNTSFNQTIEVDLEVSLTTENFYFTALKLGNGIVSFVHSDPFSIVAPHNILVNDKSWARLFLNSTDLTWYAIGSWSNSIESETTFFVDQQNGSDSNNGLSTFNPFKTITYCFKHIERLFLNGFKIKVSISDGDYRSEGEVIHLPTLTGASSNTCVSNENTVERPSPQLAIVGSGNEVILPTIECDQFGYYSIEDVKIYATKQIRQNGSDNSTCLSVSRSGVVELFDVYFYLQTNGTVAFLGTAIYAIQQGRVIINGFNTTARSAFRNLFFVESLGSISLLTQATFVISLEDNSPDYSESSRNIAVIKDGVIDFRGYISDGDFFGTPLYIANPQTQILITHGKLDYSYFDFGNTIIEGVTNSQPSGFINSKIYGTIG